MLSNAANRRWSTSELNRDRRKNEKDHLSHYRGSHLQLRRNRSNARRRCRKREEAICHVPLLVVSWLEWPGRRGRPRQHPPHPGRGAPCQIPRLNTRCDAAVHQQIHLRSRIDGYRGVSSNDSEGSGSQVHSVAQSTVKKISHKREIRHIKEAAFYVPFVANLFYCNLSKIFRIFSR